MSIKLRIPLNLTLSLDIYEDAGEWKGTCQVSQAPVVNPTNGLNQLVQGAKKFQVKDGQLIIDLPPNTELPRNCSACQDNWMNQSNPNALPSDGRCQQTDRLLAYGDLYINPPAWCPKREEEVA